MRRRLNAVVILFVLVCISTSARTEEFVLLAAPGSEDIDRYIARACPDCRTIRSSLVCDRKELRTVSVTAQDSGRLLSDDGRGLLVAINSSFRAATSESFPKDELISNFQWGACKVGANSIWLNPLEGTPATIAILDSGINNDHSDISVSSAYNCLDRGSCVEEDVAKGIEDRLGHGTFIAGIIAAEHNSGPGSGIAGIDPGVELVSVRVIGDTGIGSLDDIVAGLCLVADNELASIVSAAWYTKDADAEDVLAKVLSYLELKNILVVAAAGPQDVSIDYDKRFPASQAGSFDNVLVAGATTFTDSRIEKTAYSDSTLILGAPGRATSTRAGTSTGLVTGKGTSVSVAYVTAAAAVTKRFLCPWRTSCGKAVKNRLVACADQVTGLNFAPKGLRLNLARSVNLANNCMSITKIAMGSGAAPEKCRCP